MSVSLDRCSILTIRVTPAIDRARKYVESGADMIFAEAMTTLDEYRQFTRAVPVPVLANRRI